VNPGAKDLHGCTGVAELVMPELDGGEDR